MKRFLGVAMGVTMVLTLVGAAGASAATTKVSHPAFVAVVVNRHMVPGGVSVKLSAIMRSEMPPGTLYTWDFTNDGVFESALHRTPRIAYVYHGPMPGSSVTATVGVRFPGSPVVYTDSVTFSLRIPILHGHGPILHGHLPILHGHLPILHGHHPVLSGRMPNRVHRPAPAVHS